MPSKGSTGGTATPRDTPGPCPDFEGWHARRRHNQKASTPFNGIEAFVLL